MNSARRLFWHIQGTVISPVIVFFFVTQGFQCKVSSAALIVSTNVFRQNCSYGLQGKSCSFVIDLYDEIKFLNEESNWSYTCRVNSLKWDLNLYYQILLL